MATDQDKVIDAAISTLIDHAEGSYRGDLGDIEQEIDDYLAELRRKAAAWDLLAKRLHDINNAQGANHRQIIPQSGIIARDAVRDFEGIRDA